MSRGSGRINSNRPAGAGPLNAPNQIRLNRSATNREIFQITSNPNNIFSFDINRDSRYDADLTYKQIRFQNTISRKTDAEQVYMNRMTKGIARSRDRARQVHLYEHIIKSSKAGGGTVSTRELAKTLNAVAQEKGLIPKTAELSLGIHKDFLKKMFGTSTNTQLNRRLIYYIEQIKSGGDTAGLEKWLHAWKNPAQLKVQQEAKAILHFQKKLMSATSGEIFSGQEQATSYHQFRQRLMRSHSQGFRFGEYGISRAEILRRAEQVAGIEVPVTGPAKMKMGLPKGLGIYVAGLASIGLAGYLGAKTMRISGNDDDYNSIEGLKHGWFGASRKYLTDFGSGFNPDKLDRFAQLVQDPMILEQMEAEKEALQAAAPALGDFSETDLMAIRDMKTLEGINQKRRSLKEVKLRDYQVMVDDADTLVLKKKGKAGPDIQIRLSGIDAPETVHGDDPIEKFRIGQAQPKGKAATKRMKEILSGEGDLRLLVDADPNERTYGRYLGVIFKGNENVNLQLVEEGYVSSLEFGSQHKDAVDRATFMAAGTKAEREGIGIWGEDFFQDWKAFSAGAGRDVTFNSFTDILRLARNRYLAAGAKEMWEDGANPSDSYMYGSLYQMSNQFSGHDGDYNTIQGMKHGWFGKARERNTDFGSGFKYGAGEQWKAKIDASTYLNATKGQASALNTGYFDYANKITGRKEKPDYEDPTPVNKGFITIAGLGFGAAKYLWNKNAFTPFASSIGIKDLSYMGHSAAFLGRSQAQFKDVAYNAIRRFELGLGGIPKAFSISTMMSPSILKDARHEWRFISQTAEEFDPAFDALRKSAQSVPRTDTTGMEAYLRALSGRDSKTFGIGEGKDFQRFTGAVYEQGTLYGVTATGEYDVLLKNAKLYQNIHDRNVSEAASQFTRSYARMFGIEHVGNYDLLPGGGQTKVQSMMRTAHAFAHESLSKYLRLMDDPGKFMRDLSPSLGPVADITDKFSRFLPKMGVGKYGYAGSIGALLGRHALTALPKLVAIPFAFGMANWATRQIAPEDSVAGQAGLTGIAAEAGRLAHMTYAHVSEFTGLTALRQSAEEKAPGATGFKPWLGFTLSGMVTGTALGMAANVVDELRATPGTARYAEMLKAREATHTMPGVLGKVPGLSGKYTRAGKWGRVGGMIMAVAAAPMLLAGLGSKKTTRELDEEYLEGKEVAVKKARWWEFGTTPWEGERTMYYRPNWYRRILDRPAEKGIYGGEDISPLGKFVRDLADPYWLEKKHYFDRPYPIAGFSGEHFGLFAPLVESTIGRALKPPVLMHTESLGQRAPHSMEKDYQPSRHIEGGLAPQETISPYSLKEQIKQQYYTGYEALGLRGFITSAIKEAVTGEQDLMEHVPVLQSSADITSTRRAFWDLNLGGFGGMTEPIRRFIPKRPYTTEYVNPIKNTMPSWMPGSNYFIDFKTGDPYTKVAEGEYRLPGKGYESRYKELEGINPADYPLIHRYKILADVAPYSKEFRKARRELNKYEPTDYELKIFLETEKQLEDKRTKKKFREDIYEQSVFGRYAAALTDVARANPLEQLTPLAPAHKFAPPPTALASYEESIYGKEFKLWQRPIDDFIKPALTTAGNLVGIDRIPTHVQEARRIEQYFDELQYIKSKRAERLSFAMGSEAKARKHRRKSETTVAGVDPYSHDFRIRASLPKRERLYYEEFTNAKPEERERILELVPETMRDFYIAKWDKMLLNQIAQDQTELTEEEKRQAEKQIFNRMVTVRAKRKAYAEALTESNNIPSDNWIGWRADVDLEDIKLKYLIQTGRDYHYYDLWDDRLRGLRRKPYLEEALEEISPFQQFTGDVTYLDVYKQAIEAGVVDPVITQRDGTSSSVSYDLEYERDDELMEQLRQMGEVV